MTKRKWVECDTCNGTGHKKYGNITIVCPHCKGRGGKYVRVDED